MYLLNVNEVKTLLNIEDEDLIDQLGTLSESFIHSFCNVPSFQYSNSIEIDYKGSKQFIFNYPNIISIKEINGEEYNGVKNTHYKIVNKRKVLFTHGISLDSFGYCQFVIEAGYDETSKEFIDLRNASLLLVESLFGYIKDSRNGTEYKEISSINIGDITKSFKTGNSITGNNGLSNIDKVKVILNKYKHLSIIS